MQRRSMLLLAPLAVAFFVSGAAITHAANCAISSDDALASCATLTTKSGGTDTVPYSSPVGFTAAQINQAYGLPGRTSVSGKPPVIGIIGAFDAPTIQADLTTYSKTMGIQTLPACKGAIANSATPCFQKVDQRGGQNFSTTTSWADSVSLEVEAAHAICQNCSVLLVEADSNWSTNLFPSAAEAATLGARFINVGYVIYSQESKNYYQEWDSTFNKPGVFFAAPEAMGGYGYFTYPATSRYVTAVGGTTLTVNADGSYHKEAVYSPSTSYCDSGERKPDWQTDTKCNKRMGADVAMDADVGTGFAMYDSTPDANGSTGWFLSGGTGLAASLVAGVAAVADHNVPNMPSLPYTNYSLANFHDITQGANGTCNKGYFCNAMKGYDGPTGLGSPLGIGGF